MAFCSQCGAQIPEGSRFCSYCGTEIATPVTPVATVPVTAAPVAPTPVMTIPVRTTVASNRYVADDSVMLISLGLCSAGAAADLLEDILGYSSADARLMVASLPITIAQNLTEKQSTVLAQAFAEYGMEVTIFDHKGYRTVNPAYSSVYDASGNFLLAAAEVLGLINVHNRLTRAMIRRHDYPYGFTGVRPPVFLMPRGYRKPAPRRQALRTPPPPPRHPAPPMGGLRTPVRGAGPVGNHGGHAGPGGNAGAGTGRPAAPGRRGPGGRGGFGGPGGPGPRR